MHFTGEVVISGVKIIQYSVHQESLKSVNKECARVYETTRRSLSPSFSSTSE